MHELSVCMSLIGQVEQLARENDAASVTQIVIKVGPLSGIETDLLENAYPVAAAGTVAVDAELVIEPSDIVVHCNECGADSQAPPNRLLCAECGDYRTRIVSGDEMILQRVELTPRTVGARPAGD